MTFLHEYKAHSDPELTVLLGAHCPACDMEHGFRVNHEYWAREGKDVWYFNGNYESPTFYNSAEMKGLGSMLSNKKKWPGYPRCHSFLENGEWRFLDDSTHEMAGMEHVPMVPVRER